MLSSFSFKQKTAYEMRISDWSSDVCSSDLRTMSSHFAPRGPLPDADLRSASLIDADDVADLLGELGYPCEMEEAAERIAAIAGNDRQALVVARCEGRVCGLVALDFMYYLPLGKIGRASSRERVCQYV